MRLRSSFAIAVLGSCGALAIFGGCNQVIGFDGLQRVDKLPDGGSAGGSRDGGAGAAVATFFLGLKHSCAVLEDKSLWCWGLNDFGQLGIGGTEQQSRPKRVPLNDVVYANLGERHTCAVLEDGSVHCWGSNERAQLGIGPADSEPHDKPAKVECSAAKKVQTGRGHTCIETSIKTLECWGSNELGQLGDGTTVTKSTPTKVPGLVGVSKASIGGGDHTCAVAQASDGGAGNVVYCWGNNDKGQLGRPRAEAASSPTPLPVAGVVDPDKVFVGFEFSCATLPDTTLTCWGANEHGQLGDGTLSTRHEPRPVSGVVGMTEIGAGRQHTCGVERTSLAAKCWGLNEFGQLGSGAAGGHEPTPKGLKDTGWNVVTTRGEHTCGVREGKNLCWGRNDNGQLGTGNTTDSPTPVEVRF